MFENGLPQLDDGIFLTDGGIETTLIYHHGLELPEFAAFVLLEDEAGTQQLRLYYGPYAELARERGIGLVLEAPTWRANPAWAAKLGYSSEGLDRLNRKAIALMAELRETYAAGQPIVISGCVGPHDDGYRPAATLTAAEAHAYHSEQIGTFADTDADMVTAITMTYAEEAVGVSRAAATFGLPSAISFTVETDGRLPSGQPLREAIEQVDRDTGSAPAYYMVNCAHPTHFATVLERDAEWTERIRGLRANASTKSHEELDASDDLDEGDPAEFAARHADLRPLLPAVTVLGGCCGTDSRHVGAVCDAWISAAAVG